MTDVVNPIRIFGWYQLSLHATQEGTQRVNTFNFIGPNTEPDPSNLQALAADFGTKINLTVMHWLTTNCNLDFIEARYLGTVGSSVAAQSPFTQPSPGGLASPGAGNVAGGLRLKTGKVGKRYRGRISTFGFSQGSQLGSNLSTITLSWLADFLAAYMSYRGSAVIPLFPSVASRKGLITTAIRSALIDAPSDSARERLIGRGR